MNHQLTTEGYGVRLRPVRMADAAFILWLRNLEHAKGKLGDTAADVGAQEKWLQAYFEREGDYYFIIETLGGIRVGAYGLYDHQGGTAESGRWIIRPGVPAAIPSAMLAINLGFDKLGLTAIRVTTVATNHTVLSLNQKFGFEQTRVEKGGRIIGGKPVDIVHFLLERENWPPARQRIIPFARVAEVQVRQWEAVAGATANPR